MVQLIHPRMVRWVGTVAVALAGTMSQAPRLAAAEPKVEASTPAAAPGLLPVAEPQTLQAQPGDVEVVQERYPNRKIKVERQVIRDASGDIVNHGQWTMWSETGRLMVRGECRNGARHGTWVRHFDAGEASCLNNTWGKLFKAPFLATGTFVDGKLTGVWAIVDADERPVARWEYEQGLRHGKSVWYFPDGNAWREVEYRDGEIDGRLIEYSSDKKVVADETYSAGRRRGIKVEWFSPGVKKTQAEFLFALDRTETREDWLAGASETKVIGKDGHDERDGTYTVWYRNGQKAMEGTFRNDEPNGKFSWWHPSGQRAIEGHYTAGQQSDRWQWWYDSGRKQIVGQYTKGEQIGEWSWYNTDGQATQSIVYNIGAGAPAVQEDFDSPAMPPVPEPQLTSAPKSLSNVSRSAVKMPTAPQGEKTARPAAKAKSDGKRAEAKGMLELKPAVALKPIAAEEASVPAAQPPLAAEARPSLTSLDEPALLEVQPSAQPAKRPGRQAVRPAKQR
ncbi:MAG: hypothetical protein JSS27_01600 [Planctomycetes bacterium]|nr:hypothetical protein [Planctomycetota bacterium]